MFIKKLFGKKDYVIKINRKSYRGWNGYNLLSLNAMDDKYKEKNEENKKNNEKIKDNQIKDDKEIEEQMDNYLFF